MNDLQTRIQNIWTSFLTSINRPSPKDTSITVIISSSTPSTSSNTDEYDPDPTIVMIDGLEKTFYTARDIENSDDPYNLDPIVVTIDGKQVTFFDAPEISDSDDEEGPFVDAREIPEINDSDLDNIVEEDTEIPPQSESSVQKTVNEAPTFQSQFDSIDLTKRVIDPSLVPSLDGLPKTCTLEEVANFICTTLGTATESFLGPTKLLRKREDFEKLGSAVTKSINENQLNFSCLAFNAFVFRNPDNRKHVRAVLNNRLMSASYIKENGSKLSQVFPKEDFEKNQALIRGFAEYLKISDSETVIGYFRDQNWKELLIYLSNIS